MRLGRKRWWWRPLHVLYTQHGVVSTEWQHSCMWLCQELVVLVDMWWFIHAVLTNNAEVELTNRLSLTMLYNCCTSTTVLSQTTMSIYMPCTVSHTSSNMMHTLTICIQKCSSLFLSSRETEHRESHPCDQAMVMEDTNK